jgi:NADPH:quinone reductase-like Zn-dependent oxidoreductase
MQPGGRLATLLGASLEQTGRDDITVIPIYASATAEKVSALVDAAASGALRVPIAQIYTLDRAAEALVDFGGHKLGKIVVSTR